MKITSIEARRISQPVRPEFAIVSAAGTHPESHYVVVELETADGTRGYGEATVVPVWSGESQATAEALIRACLAPALIGQDVCAVRRLAAAMDRALIGNPFTKAAVEAAILDAAAKAMHVPVHVLLGGPMRGPAVPMRFSIGGFPAARAAQVAAEAKAMGIRAVKVKTALGFNEDVARLEAVRSAVGAGFRLSVDANGGWTESDVLRILPVLERLEVNCIEQPLARGDFRGCARLRTRTRIPLMLDESVFTPGDALRAIAAEACDMISVYPGKNGGMLRSLAIAEMAATAGLRCTIGSNLEMDLGTAAMLHTAVALPNLADTVDHDVIGPLYYARQFAPRAIRFENGCAMLPEGPGLGCGFTAESLERAAQ